MIFGDGSVLGSCCGYLTESPFRPFRRAMQPAKRAQWETKGASKGLSLDDPSQLRIVPGKPLDGFQQIGIECVHNESIRWSFANIATVQTLSSLETCSVFVLITKGCQEQNRWLWSGGSGGQLYRDAALLSRLGKLGRQLYRNVALQEICAGPNSC